MSFEPETLTLEALRASEPPSFIERRPETLTAWYVAEFERLTGRTLYPAQTEMYSIEVMAYAKSVLGEAVQTAFLQNRAVWATGRHLEEIGANVSTFKLTAQPARVSIRASLTATRASATVVPDGAVLLAGGGDAFALDGGIVIPAGQLFADGQAKAIEAGSAGNGYQVGQVTAQLVVSGQAVSLVNTEVSVAGADQEDEEAYRARVCDAFERISKAGPRAGYIQMVKQVSPEIIDVDPKRTAPGYIEITPLTKTGVASDALDEAILAWLDPEIRVPMGDYVSIAKAVATVFNPTVTARVRDSQAPGLEGLIDAAIRKPFDAWSKMLAGQIAPEGVRSSVKAVPGVIDVDGDVGFVFTALASNAFAELGDVTITLIEVDDV
ncbi:MAG: phage baseplate assembly protein [Hoeflea sp.]|uniref:baseplate J/gp47 family protein n=1 Tax=Hoeflea sp. TaxID=1940281 RepID=UPI000C10BF00|nr:baseplate J/gp47 family protein [Hoeflea sp.]PHR19302.1 MAG: phage baseplate assembly protein [Hoeflea sp.]